MYPTLQCQIDTEQECKAYLKQPTPALNVAKHVAFLLRGLEPLSEGYVSLDAARPWLFYWCLNGLALLPGTEQRIQALIPRVRESVRACQSPEGGFGGGYGQLAHLAPTYAAILSLAITADEECYAVVDRRKLYTWIMSLKQDDGGFAIQRDGEVDARAAYLALSVASLMNILTPEMIAGTKEWLANCQRYEGGLSAVHNAEAHGGLAYCALSAMCILGAPRDMMAGHIDSMNLLDWLTSRQMSLEGGFSGRTNKLVDGCYSWWIGGEFALVEASLDTPGALFNREALSEYILSCCQIPRRGGLRDKPEKQPDYYHTCYCLAGLSAAQHQIVYDVASQIDDKLGWQSFSWTSGDNLEGNKSDRVNSLHPVYAIPWGLAERVRSWAVKEAAVTQFS